MRMHKIFDPYKVRPEDYRSRYPELKRINEFEELSATELICIWHYSNSTSDIIGMEATERIVEALKRSNYTPTKALKSDLLSLAFPEKWALAIDRMSRFEPDIRMKARSMIEEIIKNYSTLCDIEDYKEYKDDNDKTGEVNRKQYVDATKAIATELPALIAKLEEGFGVSSRDGDESEQSFGFSREWYKGQE